MTTSSPSALPNPHRQVQPCETLQKKANSKNHHIQAVMVFKCHLFLEATAAATDDIMLSLC